MLKLALPYLARLVAYFVKPAPGTTAGTMNGTDVFRYLLTVLASVGGSAFFADVLVTVSSHAAELFTPKTASIVVGAITVVMELARRLQHEDPAVAQAQAPAILAITAQAPEAPTAP